MQRNSLHHMTDKVIQQKHPHLKRYLFIAAAVALISGAIFVGSSTFPSTMNTDKGKLTIATAKVDLFQEYIAMDGMVLPVKTIYLDAIEGGRVAERFVDDGARVVIGQPLLKLINTDLQLDFLQKETQAFDLINNLQNARNNLENTKVNRLNQLAEIEFLYNEAERQFKLNQQLFNQHLISDMEYAQFKNNYDYQKRKKQLTEKAIQQDSITAYEQMKQMRESYARMQSNLALMRQKTADLIVKAPATGQLSSFRAEIGELKTKGQNLGQLDILNGYKIRVQIDEHYISRIFSGQKGQFNLNGKNYVLTVRAIYPQVSNGHFDADMEFVETQPEQIKKGQNLQVRLQLGENEKALLIPKGGFYQSTGGNWIYVLDPSGNFAEKRTIKTGRQNPEFYEIMEGLEEGEQVITSSYQTLGAYDRINFN
jgi:HlyD family secretion protein